MLYFSNLDDANSAARAEANNVVCSETDIFKHEVQDNGYVNWYWYGPGKPFARGLVEVGEFEGAVEPCEFLVTAEESGGENQAEAEEGDKMEE